MSILRNRQFIFIFTILVSQGLSFLVMLYLARNMGPSIFGDYVIYNVYGSLISTAITLSVSSSIVPYYNKNGFGRSLMCLIILFHVLLVFILYFFYLLNSHLFLNLPFISIVTMITIGNICLSSIYSLCEEQKINDNIKLFFMFSLFGGVVSSLPAPLYFECEDVVNFSLDEYFIYRAKIIAFITSLFIGCLFPYQSIRGANLKIIKNVINYSVPLAISNLSAIAKEQTDKLVLERFVMSSVLGVYGLSSQLVIIYTMIVNKPLQMAYNVEVYKQSDGDCLQGVVDKFVIYFSATVFLGAILISGPLNEIVFQLVGQDYDTLLLYTPIMIFCAIPFTYSYLMNTAILKTRKSKIFMRIFLSGVVINLVVVLFLVKFISIYSVFFSLFITNSFILFATIKMSNKIQRYKFVTINLLKTTLLTYLSLLVIIVTNYMAISIFPRVACYVVVVVLSVIYSLRLLKYEVKN